MKNKSTKIGLGIALGAALGAALSIALGTGSAWLAVGNRRWHRDRRSHHAHEF
jgi:hypothetical protein